ncbi:prolyl oligopeptidase family protein [Phenylobacterium sp.]|uniref:prolyl oligopeptidase family serine peptidase n=1 Tax=Phenylobacterium sp. TaxID=1871053 RepID=UPI0027339C71|nr:prolyl oligopeptidase family serine peptidase [Phenylobacterium sp.]MDP3853255.1 prolyl oligopeptidase family serine peptidase [Phenylobacterium sp.]
MSALPAAALPDPNDPYVYMEEIEGARAMEFARAENARSLPLLQDDPRYSKLYADALAIATAKDRIPGLGFAGDGSLRNYWQDAEHVRGIWRATSLESYRTGKPEWRTILDLDALSKAEGKNWVWKGAACLAPDDRICLVSLSDGGKDAVEVREFDAQTGQFVKDGFFLAQGKHRLAWVDADTLAVATEWNKGDVTTSGYPFIIKLLKRGQPLAAAVEVFRGKADDGGYGVSPIALRDADGKLQALIAFRPLDTFNAEHHLLGNSGPQKLPVPLKSSIQGLIDGQMLLTLEQDWTEHGVKSGDLLALELGKLKTDAANTHPTLVLRPTQSQAIEQVATTRNRLVVALYDNVKGGVLSFKHGPKGWTSTKLSLPKDVSVGIASASDRDDKLLLGVASFLMPSTQVLADAASGTTETLRTLPARFDASKLLVEQHWAISKDGTKVPYFVVRPKALKPDGSAPTLLYAYGGFQVSQTPGYAASVGKLWLERGGVYVIANIRGGGEFGPRWHEAGLKLNRMRVYDDFFAVSEDLIARKITSPAKLGIMGGSNGGLLMGVALTLRPELYKAVVVQVPLFDMVGYTHIGAGASWVGEYGDPANPEERKVIDTYSPYQMLAKGKPYPKVFLETSTKDDRVHPAHARKAAARLKELGYDYLYYENIDGGHAAAANLNETAKRQALEYTYLSQQLMD